MNINPIIILACPRSGSSLTAGLFHLHGVWVGTSRGGNENNAKGFFENTYLKKELKKFGMDLLELSHKPPQFKPGFKNKVHDILKKDGYETGLWLCKHSALYWRVWDEFKPKFILVRRNIDSIVQSNIDCGLHRGKWTREQLIDIMLAHHREMDILEKYNAVNIYTDELNQRNYNSLEKALDYCGIKMNKDLVDDFVEPHLWRH